MRTRLIAMSLMLLAAACGGTADSNVAAAPQTTAAPEDTVVVAATEAPDSTQAPGSVSTAVTEAPRTEGPSAPGFVTTLADGSKFSLVEHDRPVYLIFWAEW